jgi:hypoxanthine phosphoribosyltransferase
MIDLRPEVLLGEEVIARRVAELAAQIDRDYAGAGELVLLGVLKGAFIFLADLARRLTIPRTVEFIALSSYGPDGRRSGENRLVMDVRSSIAGRHVLVVEDIVDTGRTLDYLIRLLRGREPASLEACVLVRKPRMQTPVKPRYLGFDIPDRWVVGYGLDLGEKGRTLPYIGWVKEGVVPCSGTGTRTSGARITSW